jgi:hypothetical protein
MLDSVRPPILPDLGRVVDSEEVWVISGWERGGRGKSLETRDPGLHVLMLT